MNYQYATLFQPSVEAGLVGPEALRGWRNAPVFIRNTRYVPPAPGRVGERFLMNAILVSNGWPWLTIQEGERGAYFEALKEAQLEDNARAFGRFIVERELPLVRSLPKRLIGPEAAFV